MRELPRDKGKILEIFRHYNFQDEYEHPLENCVEFQALVDAYCSIKQGTPYKIEDKGEIKWPWDKKP